MPTSLPLPSELVNSIISYLQPRDLVAFGRTNQECHTTVSENNQILWKSTFLHLFDDPNDAWELLCPTARAANEEVEKNWNWYRELRRRLEALHILKGADKHALEANYEEVLSAVVGLMDTARLGPTPREVERGHALRSDDRCSQNIARLAALQKDGEGNNLEDFIHGNGVDPLNSRLGLESDSGPITRSRVSGMQRPDAASKLHVFYGLTAREKNTPGMRGAARRLVYNWHLTDKDTDYGPFQKGATGRVNWQLLEAIVSVASRNFERCLDGHVSMPQGFHYGIPHRTLKPPGVEQDWARATGTWLGTYSFLDYNDLFQFNVGHRPGQRPTLDDEPEACGDLMKLELKLDERDTLQADAKLQTSLDVCHDLPLLRFLGTSTSYSGHYRPLIGVRGFACLASGGREVRWRYIISYGGADQWQLEGIQPGGVRSGGVYGLWSHCGKDGAEAGTSIALTNDVYADHERDGPVGPFCYFPMELCKSTSVVPHPGAFNLNGTFSGHDDDQEEDDPDGDDDDVELRDVHTAHQ